MYRGMQLPFHYRREKQIDLVYKLLDQVKAEIERNEGGLDTIDENPGTS